MGSKHKIWTEEERKVMRNMYPHFRAQEVADKLQRSVGSVYGQAYIMGLEKTEEFRRSEYSGRTTRMRALGKNYRYRKGQEPANKGKSWQAWMTDEGRENSLKTSFAPGHTPKNTLFDGAIRIRRDRSGVSYKYIRVSVARWELLHRVEWVKVNGPIPNGLILRCKNEDTLNTNPDNWQLSDRRNHLAQNSGRAEMSDKYIALVLARRDPQLRSELMQMPQILDLKRTELILNKTINEQHAL